MIQPRRLGHRGTVMATGFVIDASLAGSAEAQRRILSLWTPGAFVREHQALFIVAGLRASRVRVATAPGTPLVEQHGVLAGTPLDPDEASELAIPGTVVVARGGIAEVLPLDGARRIELASWIDLGEFQVAAVEPLATAPARVAIPPPPNTDIRALTGAPAAHAELADTAAALMRARSSAAPGVGESSMWSRFVHWISERIAPRRRTLPAPNGSLQAKLSRYDRLRDRITRALWNSRLGMALGRRQAAYLRRVLELFDRGELEEALRAAIPIGGDGGGTRLGIGVPRSRRDLSLTFAPRHAGSVIPVADTAMAMMRDRYRAAASRLEHSGRIDEAAFVFAELLGDVKAAIALLERHGRYSVAARLGEARNVEPGLVVRLWFLAGDGARAIDTARRHGAWADAVARLERSGDSRAPVLRMLWADHLAETADFVRAVEAAWPVKHARSLVEAWIDRGIAAEGTAAARLLVKKLVIAPASFSKVASALLAMLGARDGEAVRQRIAMIEELVGSPASPELQTIARPALRALLRDRGVGAEGASSELVERLVKFADDAALRVDRPVISAVPRTPTLLDRAEPVALRWSAHDAGALPVHDAAALPGNRLLLALGELGVRIVGRNGRTIAQIDQPATRLVVSDHGTRALAIASRGQVNRIARLDLIERRGGYWCDAEFDDGAPTFDGDLWIAACGREVFATDTKASSWRAVWGVQVDPVAAQCSIRRDGRWFAIAVRDGDALEHWYYEGFTLRARRPWSGNGNEYVVARPTTQHPFVVRDPEGAAVSDVARIVAIEVTGDLAIISRRTSTGLALDSSHLKVHRTLAQLALDGATAASMRLTDNMLTIGDDRGRVIVFDLACGVTRRDLRTS
jgi:hypothetical protein